jgi:hypothetical protein
MDVVALVDFDNVRGDEFRRATLASEMEVCLDFIVERTAAVVRTCVPTATLCEVRLYGGWVDENGLFSTEGANTLAALGSVRGLRHGLRVIPVVVTSPACRPTAMLVGTVRLLTRPRRQKMVDGLMTVDAMEMGAPDFGAVFIISDDDDLVPCALAKCARSNGPVFLVRHRAVGHGLNDELLRETGVNFAVFG